MLRFPGNFLFGTATSSHQIEGNNTHNDWWFYEQSGRLKYKSGKTCNHWELYREDIKLMTGLNYNAYRFSIEWSRVFPKENEIDEKAIQKYQEIVNLLNENNVVPIVTLHHFTSPLWFIKKGGFAKEENLKYWQKYIESITELKGIGIFATFNEPMVYVTTGYIQGYWPPFTKNPLKAGRVEANLLRAHAIAYEILKSKKVRVGIVKNVPIMKPASESKADIKAKEKADNLFNWYFLDAIWSGKVKTPIKTHKVPKSDVDFIGINYYTVHEIKHSWSPFNLFLKVSPADLSERKTLMGWSVYPGGIYEAITRVHDRYEKPIYITENGIATLDDEWRVEFIIRHLQYVHKALREGYDVRGYFYWSFMDNFEWAEGFEPRFGLVEIDFETLERRPRNSARVYGKIAERKIISDELIRGYGLEI